MNKFVEEDWERVHLLDKMYLKEQEFEEQTQLFKKIKPIAKITFKLPKKEIDL